MVSLVNFKLMPEDKCHDQQELTMSSSCSKTTATTTNNYSTTKTTPIQSSNQSVINNNNNESITDKHQQRQHNEDADADESNQNNHHIKPPTPPKPQKLTNTTTMPSPELLSSKSGDTTTPQQQVTNNNINSNGYHNHHHHHHHHRNQHTTNNTNDNVTMSSRNINSNSNSNQHQQAITCCVNSDLVSNHHHNNSNNKFKVNMSHTTRHQRQVSMGGGNIHQAYCVKVAPNLLDNNQQQQQQQIINNNDNDSVLDNVQQNNNAILKASRNTNQNNGGGGGGAHQIQPILCNYNQLPPPPTKFINGHQINSNHDQQLSPIMVVKESPVDVIGCCNIINGNQQQQLLSTNKPENKASGVDSKPGRHFTVTWRDLSFVIQPKWHQSSSSKKSDLMQQSAPITPDNTTTANELSFQSVGPTTVNPIETSGNTNSSSSSILKTNLLIKNLKQTKVVLDSLDGCFKSGELTAILGPSGAGKTTLLDCLTGHRKQGLSGSIKIRSSASTDNHYNNCKPASLDKQHIYNQKQKDKNITHDATTRQQDDDNSAQCNHLNNNLKVSIIPQNDHLIGHLTVYETLSYASKMKNCFNRQFDHKTNIQRVSQQLGLLSCLSTRINKLSGGQYKRVSIAQELLSNPDILILDEPTSGLDAMTCYQTVQVLRRLADNRQLTNNQIAIILTIHQPNSDVFQQFNHVYVVAQGGKSIYEGPPSSIVSVIQRVGLNLPSINYNPATMIVEIAAGKFGYDSITKLNRIQKKQYNRHHTQQTYSNDSDDYSDDYSSSSSDGEVADKNNGSLKKKYSKKSNNKNKRTNNKENQLRQDDNNNIDGHDIVKASINSQANGGIVNKAFQPDYNRDHNALDNVIIVNSDRHLVVSQGGGGGGCGGGQDPYRGGGNNKRDNTERDKKGHRRRRNDGKRLKLNSLKADQKFPFWRHTYLHFHRSWLSIVRDPMLCGMQLFLHIIIPIMVSLVYGPNVGQPNACPRAGPMDLITFALEPEDSTLNLQEELRTTLENIGYIFFKLYGIIFAAMTVTVLTFPLDMHVLVKEFRNGWYGLSSYFLGRTLADIPFQLTLPFLAMSLSYYATGQPYSYLQWRFMSITAILILSSLIAQSQGLLFGAILMDKMKAAVFVAPAATTPIILFAGFLVRTQSIPYYLRPLSNLSYLRYAIEACLISRYGFNQCECDPAIFNQTVPELPPIARTMLDYWLSSFKAEQQSNNNLPLIASINSTV